MTAAECLCLPYIPLAVIVQGVEYRSPNCLSDRVQKLFIVLCGVDVDCTIRKWNRSDFVH